MTTRREFIKRSAALILGLSVGREALADEETGMAGKGEKIVVTPGMGRDQLVDKHPANIDATAMEATPLKEFGVMGLEDHEVDLQAWRLTVEGSVKEPLSLTYEELRALPALEKKTLLVCPGFFVNQGLWKGISARVLLEKAGFSPDVDYVTFRGPKGRYEKTLRVPWEHVRTDKVFLAHGVNGETLPLKHGFPLRVVAEGYYGYDWVKYVDRVQADVIGKG